MNWKNIKTFLIILFLGINIFLAVSTVRMHGADRLTEQNINDAVALLGQNNIYIDKSLIPTVPANLDSIELSNPLFADKSIDKSLITDSNDNGFTMRIPADTSEITEKNAESKIRTVLKNNKFKVKSIILTKVGGNKITYNMTSEHNGIKIFDNSMTLTVNDGSLVLNGTWYEYRSESIISGGKKSVHATSALIEFISAKPNDGKAVTITDIALGYHAASPDNRKNVKTISASPCYRLTTDTGMVYYYNIRDGSLTQ